MKLKTRKINGRSLLQYDSKADVLYVATKGGTEDEFIEIAPGANVELNRKKEVIGIEILGASRFFKPVLKPLERRLSDASATLTRQ